MKIYIVSHKEFDNPVSDSIYMPIQVGAALRSEVNPEWERDNTGINISEKNLSYNELTGLYWIWKNSKEDIVGLCHYRRYFVSRLGKITDVLFGKKKYFLTKSQIEKKLKKYDLIVHNKTFFINGNASQFRRTQKHPEDLEVLREVLMQKYPEYLASYEAVMENKKCHLLNILIGKKEIIDRYCEWLFSVLFEVENQLLAKGEVDFERRMGMLGERMLDIWMLANGIKYREEFSINTERKDLKFID